MFQVKLLFWTFWTRLNIELGVNFRRVCLVISLGKNKHLLKKPLFQDLGRLLIVLIEGDIQFFPKLNLI